MRPRQLRWILALYPKRWKERYGAELEGLVDDLGPRSGTATLRLALNLLVGALREWTRPHRRRLAGSAIPEGPGRLSYRYRDKLYRTTRLSPWQFGGATPLGTAIGYSRHPILRGWAEGMSWIIPSQLPLVVIVCLAAPGPVGRDLYFQMVFPLAVYWIPAYALAWPFLWLRGSYRTLLVVTSAGLVLMAVDWLVRPARVIDWQPPLRPQVVRKRGKRWLVVVGRHQVWVRGRTEGQLLSWMQTNGLA